MKPQRRGSDLKIHIRIARSSLGLDPRGIDLDRLSLVDLEAMLAELYVQCRRAGLLK